MIYDCFIFFNELDLLELRLETLQGVVDKFVLVESDQTHTNQPKPLHFAENRQRFAKFLDKIIHVVVTDSPQGVDARVCEHHQRDAILRGLRDCGPEDLILVSDLDEIPTPASIHIAAKHPGISVFEQRNCYYFLNATNGYWHGTRAAPFKSIGNYPPAKLRFASGRLIQQGGWHFSFLGGTEAIISKIKAYSHQEYNRDSYLDEARIIAALDTGSDIFSRRDASPHDRLG